MSAKPKASKKDGAMAVALRALQIAQGGHRDVEVKRFQQYTTQTNYLAGSVTNLNTMAQGDTVSTRTGDRIRQQRVKIRLTLATFTDSDVQWRVLLVSDKRQVSGTAPSVTTVLDSDSALSPYSVATQGRFTVHRDFSFSQNARFLNGDMADTFVWDVPLNDQPAGFAGGTLNANGLYLLITCDVCSAGGMAGKPAVGDCATRFSSDLFYTDA